MKIIASLAIAVTVLSVSPAYANDSIDEFGKLVDSSIAICSISVTSAIVNRQSEILSAKIMERQPKIIENSEVKECISKRKSDMTSQYKKTVGSIVNKKQAVDALKSYFAFALSVIETVEPQPGERQFQYDARMSSSHQTLSQMLNMVKIEAM